MSNLKNYLDIVTECRKNEAVLLRHSLKFFADITIKITEAYKEHGIKHLSDINVLDYNGLAENQTSDFIKQILAYEHNGDYSIWLSFVKTFFSEEIATSIKHPIFSSQQQNIDICVKEHGRYAFIFENKLKGAAFQRNQLGRYVTTMLSEKYDPENIYVIILPGWIDNNFINHIRKSVWNAPEDWNKPNNDRKCCDSGDQYACWCDNIEWKCEQNKWCEGCHDRKKLFNKLDDHVKVIDRQLPEWLIQTAMNDNSVPSDEILMRAAMIQFADYIKGLYKIRLNQKEVMENIKVLTKELALDPENPEESYNKVTKTLNELNGLQQSMKTLQTICRIKIWQKEIENLFPDARVDSEENNFGILINGIYCGIWIENDKPFWGFYHDPNTIEPEGAKDMIKQIIGKTTVESDEPTSYFLASNWTEKGAEDIKSFLNAAEELNFHYQRKAL